MAGAPQLPHRAVRPGLPSGKPAGASIASGRSRLD